MLACEESRHATAATVIESLSFNEKEVLLTQIPRIIDVVASKNTISQINRATIDRYVKYDMAWYVVACVYHNIMAIIPVHVTNYLYHMTDIDLCPCLLLCIRQYSVPRWDVVA